MSYMLGCCVVLLSGAAGALILQGICLDGSPYWICAIAEACATCAGRALVLDHGTAIYVLLGSREDAAASEAHTFVETLATGRLPLPDVRFIDAVSVM